MARIGFHLVRTQRPPVIFGEQVDAAIAHGWLDLVQDDLEGRRLRLRGSRCPLLRASGLHIRQRLWLVADSDNRGKHSLLRGRQDDSTQTYGQRDLCDWADNWPEGTKANLLMAHNNKPETGRTGASATTYIECAASRVRWLAEPWSTPRAKSVAGAPTSRIKFQLVPMRLAPAATGSGGQLNHIPAGSWGIQPRGTTARLR